MELLNNFSTREKNLWSELLVDVVVGLYYYPRVYYMVMTGNGELTGAAMAGLITSTIMLAIVISVIISVFLHTQKKPEHVDERDFQFDYRGSKLAYAVLAVCASLVIGVILVYELQSDLGASWTNVALTPMVIAHLLLVSLFLSSVIKTVVQLFYYRRGY